MIYIDTNAAEDFFVEPLLDIQLPVTRKRLDVGDIHLSFDSTNVVLERKTWEDLAASICDSRWSEQKSRMLCSARDDSTVTHYGYIIEGPIANWKPNNTKRLSQTALWAALIKTQIRDGMSVFHTVDKSASIDTVAYIFKQLKLSGFVPKSCNVVPGMSFKRKRDNLDSPHKMCVAMLSIIPGMSKTKAEKIACEYQSMADLMIAPVCSLSNITCNGRKIGPVLAHRIVSLLSSKAGQKSQPCVASVAEIMDLAKAS